MYDAATSRGCQQVGMGSGWLAVEVQPQGYYYNSALKLRSRPFDLLPSRKLALALWAERPWNSVRHRFQLGVSKTVLARDDHSTTFYSPQPPMSLRE